MPVIENISDTARWVAWYRAAESERPDALFRDPLARRLAGGPGEQIVRSLPGASRAGWVIAVRTAVLDELILQAVQRDGVDLVLNLAAGLDTRPYRLDVPASLKWFEVDLPAMVEEKKELLASETPRCSLERVAADLSDVDARRAVFARIAEQGSNVLVLTEGLLMYLEDWQVASLASDLAQMKSFRWWATDSVGPFVRHAMNLFWHRQLPGGASTFKFAPVDHGGFFTPFGWNVRAFRSYEEESLRLGRAPLISAPWHRLRRSLFPSFRMVAQQSGGMWLLERRRK